MTTKCDVCSACSMSNQNEQTKRKNKRRSQKKTTAGNGAVLAARPHTDNYMNNLQNKDKLLHGAENIQKQQQNCEQKIQKQPLHVSMEQLRVNTMKDKTNVNNNNNHNNNNNNNNNNINSKPNVSRRAAGANWKVLHKPADSPIDNIPPKPQQNLGATAEVLQSDQHAPNTEQASASKSARQREKRRRAIARNRFVAIDCEMVGIGVNGQDDMLARVSIVNKDGKVLMDKYVKPREKVIDYRTCVSGIRPHDIENGEEFHKVQDEVVDLLQGKILIGHAINNDLAVLHISHPYSQMRDTSSYRPLCRLVSNGHTPSLKKLAKVILGIDIQNGEHSSVEDARAAMSIYNKLSSEWEKHHKYHGRNRSGRP